MKTKLFLLLTPILLVLGCFALLPVAKAAGGQTSNVKVVNAASDWLGPVPTNVVNTPASPVPVRDVDNPARQPFQAQAVGGFADGASTTGDVTITTVPAGKLLIIEHVSVFGAMLPGQKMVRARLIIRWSTPGGSLVIRPPLVIRPQGSNADGTRDYFVASEPVRFYAGDGLVSWEAERDSSAGANPTGIDINCEGYLVDCPDCAL